MNKFSFLEIRLRQPVLNKNQLQEKRLLTNKNLSTFFLWIGYGIGRLLRRINGNKKDWAQPGHCGDYHPKTPAILQTLSESRLSMLPFRTFEF